MRILAIVFELVLILGGVVACAGLIAAQKPDAQKYLEKLVPFQAVIGLTLIAFGIIFFVVGGPIAMFKAIKVEAILGVANLGGVLIGIILGFLLALATWERDGTIHGLTRPKDAAIARLGPVPVIAGGIVLIAFLTENAAENWSALHIEQTLGGTPAEGAMGPAVLALTMGFARLAGQGVVARLNPSRLMGAGCVVAAFGALMAAGATGPGIAYAGFIVMGIGSSVIAPTAFSLAGRLAHPEARARAVARATFFGYFGYFFGPPMLGVIAGAFGLRMAFVVAAGILMLVLVLAPLLARAGRG